MDYLVRGERARIVPIGDGLGRVLAEIIRYVKRFYNSESVPVCDHWDLLEKRPHPRARYLIQGIRHPGTAGVQTIRSRIREISIAADAGRSDGRITVAAGRLPTRLCIRTSQQQHAPARYSSAVRARLS